MRERKSAPSGGYKLIAVDLDGTLLGIDGAPHAADVAALRAARERGIHVTINTGRLYAGSRAAALAIGAEGLLGCADGSHIVRGKTHETILHRALEGAGATALRELLQESDATPFVFTQETIFHDERATPFLPYVRIWSDDLRAEKSVFDAGVWNHELGMTAVVAIGREEEIQRIVTSVSAHDSVQIAHFPLRRVAVGTWGMIVRAGGGTKGSALEHIAKDHGITVDECVVVGDWHNDVPMLSIAGRGFAMAQAPDNVKAVATDVLVESVLQGGGIASAIKEAFGEGR